MMLLLSSSSHYRSGGAEAYHINRPALHPRTVQKNRLSTALKSMPHYECATAAVMSGLGDILAQIQLKQKINDGSKLNIKWKRTLQFMCKGFGEGFLWTLWYRNAEHYSMAITRALTTQFAANAVLTTLVGTAVALILDLTLACPFIYGLWDIPFPLLIKRAPLREIRKSIREKLGEMLMASVKVWTPVNILIYNVPVQYRVFIMSFADVFWQSIVSSITTAPTEEPEAGLSSNANAQPA